MKIHEEFSTTTTDSVKEADSTLEHEDFAEVFSARGTEHRQMLCVHEAYKSRPENPLVNV